MLAAGPAGEPLDRPLKQVKERVISEGEVRLILTERTARPRDTRLLGVFSKASKEAGVAECCVRRDGRRQARGTGQQGQIGPSASRREGIPLEEECCCQMLK